MKLARLTLIAPVCGLALLAAGTGQTATAVAGAPVQSALVTTAKKNTNTATVKIATYNTKASMSVGRAVADIEKLASTGADVVALQEMSSAKKRKAVRAALLDCNMCPYEGYMPTPAVPGGTPILYRWDQFRLEETGTRQVTEDTWVGHKGAGPATLRAKYINFVKLRERATGHSVYVLNNHAVPTVQGSGGGANQDHPTRLELYRQHMDGLKAMITEFKATGAAVFVTGDFNVNFKRDRVVKDPLFPYVNMREVGVQASYEYLGAPRQGTHGKGSRLIDYVFYLNHGGVTPVSQRVLKGYRSDHKPVLVGFQLTS